MINVGSIRYFRAALLVLFLGSIPEAASGDDVTPPPTMSADATAELRAAIDILKTHHMDRAKLDWPKTEAQVFAMAKDAKSPADTYSAIRYIIEMLGEKHTFLQTADAFKAMTSDRQVGSAAPPPFNPPEGMLLANRIAFLRVPWFLGNETNDRAYVAALRQALNRFAAGGICRYVVDLRGNSGGNMYPMLNGVKALLGRPPYGFWDTGGGARVPWTINDAPNPLNATSAPPAPYADAVAKLDDARVAVLVDNRTVSSGEFTAMAFEGRPHTRLFGEPTGGYVTTNAPYSLPDGARLLVSEGWATDRIGRPYRTAIVPDEETATGQATLDAALRWLKTQPCNGTK